MSWIRAVWLEGEKEEEGTIPDLWIEQDSVLWPPVANGLRFLKEISFGQDKEEVW